MATVLVITASGSSPDPLVTALEDDGHETRVGGDAASIESALASDGIDVVAIDVDAVEPQVVDRAADLLVDRNDVPVITISDGVAPGAEAAALGSVACTHLTRPLAPDTIRTAVHGALRYGSLLAECRRRDVEHDALVRDRTAAIAERESIYRAFFDRSPIGKCMTAPDGRLQRVNAALGEFLGYEPDDLVALSFEDITHPDDIERSRECVRTLLAGERDVDTLEKRYRTRDGRYVWAYVTTRILRDDRGEPLRFLTHILDIDDKRRVEDELGRHRDRLATTIDQERETRRRFQHLYENMAQGVVHQDAAGRIERCNPAAERILGLSLAQMQGRTSTDPNWKAIRTDGTDYPGEEHPAMVALRTGRPASGLMGLHVPSDPRPRWIAISAIPEFEDGASAPTGVFTTFEDVTAIRRAEELLRETQAIAGLGRWELDHRTGELQWSESIYQLFEVEPGSVVATYGAFLEFVHPEDRDVVNATFRRSVKAREPYALTHRLRMADGRIKWVKEMGRTTYAGDGTPLVSVGTVQDVTELKVAEQELRSRELAYRKLFEGAPVGIFQTTSGGRVLSVNPALAAMLDFPSVEAALAHFDDLGMQLYVDPERRSEFLTALAEHGQVTGFEYEARSRSGRRVWLNMSARIARRQDDGTFVIEGFTTDVTGRKRVEQELLRNRALLTLTGEIARVGGWEYDIATGTPYLTEETLRIFDLPPDHDLPVERGLDHYHPDDVADVRRAFERAIEHGEPYDLEARIVSARGRSKWVQTIGRPQVVDGHVVKLIGTIQDISRRKQHEMEQARLEERFRQSQKLETVGRLAGGVAHDFNNLLTVITSYAEFAVQALADDHPIKPNLAQILESSERAANLTRQLLAFSRRQVLEPQVLDPNTVVRRVETMIRRLIGEDITLVTELDDHVGAVSADPGQLEQVLMNLAINARDAMPAGGTLTIRTANVEADEAGSGAPPELEPGRYVRLEVADDGEGMPEHVRDRIFEPFFTTKEQGRGTGLGLSTVYGIVKQSDGAIQVRSELDRGSTFTIHLPRVDARPPRESVPVRPVHDAHGRETVLVVEDEPAVRELVQRILAAAGYRPIVAVDGDEALRACERHRDEIRLVLTDVVMPKVGGKELATRLARLAPDLRVLFMSGYTDDAMQKHGVLEPGTHFIAKPFRAQELLSKVRMVLDLD